VICEGLWISELMWLKWWKCFGNYLGERSEGDNCDMGEKREREKEKRVRVY
jgi:hypothetical protein